MDFEIIKERVAAGNYFVGNHAFKHSLEEGFSPKLIAQAVLNGIVIEEYPDAERVLIRGRVKLEEEIQIYLHVVCEYSDEELIYFVTAYIPDGKLWGKPPYQRRKKK